MSSTSARGATTRRLTVLAVAVLAGATGVVGTRPTAAMALIQLFGRPRPTPRAVPPPSAPDGASTPPRAAAGR